MKRFIRSNIVKKAENEKPFYIVVSEDDCLDQNGMSCTSGYGMYFPHSNIYIDDIGRFKSEAEAQSKIQDLINDEKAAIANGSITEDMTMTEDEWKKYWKVIKINSEDELRNFVNKMKNKFKKYKKQ